MFTASNTDLWASPMSLIWDCVHIISIINIIHVMIHPSLVPLGARRRLTSLSSLLILCWTGSSFKSPTVGAHAYLILPIYVRDQKALMSSLTRGRTGPFDSLLSNYRRALEAGRCTSTRIECGEINNFVVVRSGGLPNICQLSKSSLFLGAARRIRSRSLNNWHMALKFEYLPGRVCIGYKTLIK